MRKKKTYSVYYYRVEVPKSLDNEKEEHLLKIRNAFTFPEREGGLANIKQTQGIINLIDNKIDEDIVFGTFNYVQMENLPSKFHLIEKTNKHLNVEEEEGLNFLTSFIYDTKTDILAIMSSRPMVNVSSILYFMIHNYKLPEFELNHVINTSELESIIDKTIFKKFEVSFAQPSNISNIYPNSSISKLAEVANVLEADHVKYEIRSERGKTLNANSIKRVLRNISNLGGKANLTKLKVTGDNKDEVFDFLAGVLKGSISLEINRHGNHNYQELYEKLEYEFNLNKVSLRNIYTR